MAAWQKAGQTRKAMSVFEEAVWSEVADVEVCNAAIAICVNSKQTKVSPLSALLHTCICMR